MGKSSSSRNAAVRRVRLHIHGRVQGVFFRHHAQQRARTLRLAGWVRNCPDGSVELVAEGDDRAVQQLIEWAHRGPSMAGVERVELAEEAPEGGDDFRVLG